MDCISQVLLGDEYSSEAKNPLTVVIFDLLLEAQQLIYDLSWIFPLFSKLFSHFRLLNGRQKRKGLFELIAWAYATVRLRKKVGYNITAVLIVVFSSSVIFQTTYSR
jgi:hypothetical protein